MQDVPKFNLSLGQVTWAISRGQPPDPKTVNELRYLRRLGVPFPESSATGAGRGNRLTYGYDELIECAVAMYAVRHRMLPRHVAKILVGDRRTFRKLYRAAFLEAREGALEAPWVKSQGRIRPPTTEDELFIRLHENYAAKGEIKMMTIEEMMQFGGGLGDLIEHYTDGSYPLVPLRRVVLETVAWALIAPPTPAGRPTMRN